MYTTEMVAYATGLNDEQREAVNAWVDGMTFRSSITREEALATVLDWLINGRETEIRNIVTLKFEPHTIRYTWHRKHWCPGYYDCLRCAG